MSPGEDLVSSVWRALREHHLEAIVVGSMAGALQGVPITTQDLDLLIRDTPRNRTKLDAVADSLGAARPRPIGTLTTVVRISGLPVPIDFLFDELTRELSFESLRSRAVKVPLGEEELVVAALDDIIVAKQTANRLKDQAQLPMLRATAAVLKLRK